MARISPSSSTRFETLLETESSLMYFMCEPAISTISFFEGKDVRIDYSKSLEHIKNRIASVCRANPWLASRLVRDKKRDKSLALLAVPDPITDEDIEAIIFTDDPKLSDISVTSTHENLNAALKKSNAVVPIGYKLLNKDLRVSKFSLLPIANGQVAFILSITHSVVDGFTYYKIMNMLTEGREIDSLSFVRKHEFVSKMKEACGTAEHKLLLSTGFILTLLPGMLCGPKAKCDARFIDEEKVRQLKLDIKSRSTTPDDEFVCSTNDIITSAFSRATKSEILLMAINLRNRVSEASDNDAGNYESVVLYDAPGSESPEAVRSALRGGVPFIRRGNAPLPSFFQLLRGVRVSIITNWAFSSFRADLQMLDEEARGVPLTLHLPVYDYSSLSFPVAVIFRPCVNKLAVLYMGPLRDISYFDLMACGAPLGMQVNEAMFPE